jgi:uncharacterized protein YggE
VIDAADKSGATLNSLTFTLSEDAPARQEAIRLASEDAKAKAVALANSMGVKLGPTIRISTNAQAAKSQELRPTFNQRSRSGDALAAIAPTSTPLRPERARTQPTS